MRTLFATESLPYEQTKPNMADSGGRCVLCKGQYRTIGEFIAHRCAPAVALRSVTKRHGGHLDRDAENGTSDPRTEAGSEAVKRNTPGRKKVHRSNADRQRSYRERKRTME